MPRRSGSPGPATSAALPRRSSPTRGSPRRPAARAPRRRRGGPGAPGRPAPPRRRGRWPRRGGRCGGRPSRRPRGRAASPPPCSTRWLARRPPSPTSGRRRRRPWRAPISAGTRLCMLPRRSDSSMRLAVQGDGLAALPTQQLDVAEQRERVADVVRAEPFPDLLGPVQVAEGVVETSDAEVRLAAVVVGEVRRTSPTRSVRRSRWPGRARRCLLVVALLGVVAAAVGVDPHELDDVAGAFGVDECPPVLLGVGPPVAAASPRPSLSSCAASPARRRRRTPSPATSARSRSASQPSMSARIHRIAACHASSCASSAGSLPSTRPSSYAASASSSRPRR